MLFLRLNVFELEIHQIIAEINNYTAIYTSISSNQFSFVTITFRKVKLCLKNSIHIYNYLYFESISINPKQLDQLIL